MKKVFIVFLCAALFAGALAGCGGESPEEAQVEATPTPASEVSEEPSAEPTIEASAEPTPSRSEVPETEETITFDVESVRDRFITYQGAVDNLLGNDTTIVEVLGEMELEQDEENSNEYKIPLVVWDSYVYFLTDDNGEAIAGIAVTPKDAYDAYKGKRQAVALSYALAPNPTTAGEEALDRIEKIDSLNPASADFQSFGDVLNGESIMLSSGVAEGFIMYFGLRMSAPEEERDKAVQWTEDVIKKRVAIAEERE